MIFVKTRCTLSSFYIFCVGLSNILDGELVRGKPVERPHREVVGTAIVDGKLLCEVIQGKERVRRIEALLVLPVAALDLSVVTGGIGADELVSDTQRGSGGLKQSGQKPSAVGKSVGELKAIVGLDALHPDAPAGIPLEQPFQEVGGGVGTLFRIGSQEAQAGELIYGGVLEQAEFRVRNAPAGHHLHVHLDPLAGIGHLLVRLGFVRFLFLGRRKQPQFAHDTEQTFRTAGIASFPQPVPQLHHAQVRIAAAHIPDQLQFRLCVLVGVVMRPPGPAGQRLHRPIPASFPEVDI